MVAINIGRGIALVLILVMVLTRHLLVAARRDHSTTLNYTQLHFATLNYPSPTKNNEAD